MTPRGTGKLLPVCGCGARTVIGSTLCAECGLKLRYALMELDALPDMLMDTASRQSRGAPGPSARTRDRPLPYQPAAADAIHHIGDTLARWVDACNTGEPWPPPGTEGGWLIGRLHRHPRANTALDELRALVTACRDIIDVHGGMIFCGPCTTTGCHTALYRRRGDQAIMCGCCQAVYDVADRQAWVRQQVAGQVLPARYLVEALALLGHTVTENRIKVWAHRGRIAQRGKPGAPTYAVADALHLLEEQSERAARRKPRGHAHVARTM